MYKLKSTSKAKVITFALVFLLNSNIIEAQQYLISSPELRKQYNIVNRSEVYYLILDFNDCFNCTQNLRFIEPDSNRAIFIALINYPTSKIPQFEKEYKLKFKPRYLDESTIETLGLNQYKKYASPLNSFIIRMTSESIIEIHDFRKYKGGKNKNELQIVDSLSFKDTLFYSSFYQTGIIEDGFVTILSPKNIAVKYNKSGVYVKQLNLDNFYLSDDMFDFIKNEADTMLGNSSKLDLITNYMTYAKPYGYNSTMISNCKVLKDKGQLLFVVNFTVAYSKGDKISIMFHPALVITDYDLNVKSIDWIKIEKSGDFYGIIPYDFFLDKNSIICQSITFNKDYYRNEFTYYPFFRSTKKSDSSNVFYSSGIDSCHSFKIDASKWNIKEYTEIKYMTVDGQYLLFNNRPILYNINEKKLLELGFETNWNDTGINSFFHVLYGCIDSNNNLDYCFYYNKNIYILKLELKNGIKILDYHVLISIPKGELVDFFKYNNNYSIIVKDLKSEMREFKMSTITENK